MEPHIEIVSSHEFWMLPVEGGNFLMGSLKGDGDNAERPQHEVTVGDFYIGKFSVTQAFWKAVMKGENPSNFKSDDLPVEHVSWNDAHSFIKKLNDLTVFSRPQGLVYRLPSEAEWEYAARGGKYHKEGYNYAGSDRLKDVGWFNENSVNETKPVGLKNHNQLGLYDLSGNVWEWCEDDWHYNYEGAPKNSLAWIDSPERGPYRVLRGGSWLDRLRTCRVTNRSGLQPIHRGDSYGFRLALARQ